MPNKNSDMNTYTNKWKSTVNNRETIGFETWHVVILLTNLNTLFQDVFQLIIFNKHSRLLIYVVLWYKANYISGIMSIPIFTIWRIGGSFYLNRKYTKSGVSFGIMKLNGPITMQFTFPLGLMISFIARSCLVSSGIQPSRWFFQTFKRDLILNMGAIKNGDALCYQRKFLDTGRCFRS